MLPVTRARYPDVESRTGDKEWAWPPWWALRSNVSTSCCLRCLLSRMYRNMKEKGVFLSFALSRYVVIWLKSAEIKESCVDGTQHTYSVPTSSTYYLKYQSTVSVIFFLFTRTQCVYICGYVFVPINLHCLYSVGCPTRFVWIVAAFRIANFRVEFKYETWLLS